MKKTFLALSVCALFSLSSCSTLQVHPLPPTLNNQPTRAWLQNLYVRFDYRDGNEQPTFDVIPWLKTLSKQGAHVLAYQFNPSALSSDAFVKALSPTAVLNVSWHLLPTGDTSQDSSNTSQSGKLKVTLTTADSTVVLASDEWTFQGSSEDDATYSAQEALMRWLTPKGSSVLPAASSPASSWFSTPLAVLPFSDEVNNTQAPEMLRKMAFERLRQAGYALVPLADIDAALLRQGFSQGGQLKNVKPQDIAKWVGASRLLYGNLETFNNITLGVIGKRQVGGKFSLWDQAQGSFLWSNEGNAYGVDSVSHLNGGEILGHFINQMASSWWGAISKKPLAAESAQFVDGVLTLPLQPPANN